MLNSGNHHLRRAGLGSFFGLCLLLVTGSAAALDRANLAIGHIQGVDWQAEGVILRLDLAADSGELKIARLKLPPPVGELKELTIACKPLKLDDQVLSCPQARFHLGAALLDQPGFTGSFHYAFATRDLRMQINDLALGGTRLQVSARQEGSRWHAELRAPQLSLSSADGKYASDKLAIKMALQAWPNAQGWNLVLGLEAAQGQAYAEPVFMDFGQSPLKLDARGQWQGQVRQLVLDELGLDQPGSLRAQATLRLDFSGARPPLQAMQLQIHEALLPGAYTRYLQPFLIGTVLDSLETQGRVEGRIGYADGKPEHVRLRLSELHLDDKKKRFALYDVNGAINWRSYPPANTTEAQPVTQLRWSGGNAYRLDLGATELRLATSGGDVRLLAPTRVPVLDGALDIRKFELVAAGTPAVHMAFDGALQPLGMERLCRALGWPVFGGTLSGAIPTLEYREGNLTVGGTLAANVFDGRVEVDRLRLEQPFGSLPRLSADMKLRRIDLKAATSAFSFGRIEGRLDGDVKNLRLLKWNPVAFDGRLYTSPDDDTRHRISQRAIENISNLGGAGAAGVLSRGFLRFFKDFAYDRIALGCRLQDGVCHMTGLEPHRSGGYYIVKGSLLPRIDVIGFATRVSWSGFVEQLKSATKSEGPVIE